MLTVKNENNHNAEKLLKDKMNELSDHVNCFDKISARAFPEKDEDFSESGFAVNDLENITVKAKKLNFIKWTTIAVASLICIAVIPQTNLVHNIMSNIGTKSTRQNYENIIAEINTEIQNDNYIVDDYPLDYYIKNDVLVTPLFACPFENCGKEDANVRIYTKYINGLMTNQVYAVEYVGTYSEENIVAVAKSEYTFSDEDIADAEQYDLYGFFEVSSADLAIRQNFRTNSNGLFIDDNQEAVSLASFQNFTIMKYDGGVIPITSEILYGHKTMSDDSYFYDIKSTENNNEIQLPEREEMWKTSVYFNGNTAFPQKSNSIFIKTDLFKSDSAVFDTECAFVSPFDSDYQLEQDEIISVYADDSGKRLSTIIPPADKFALLSTKLYFSTSAFNNDEIYVNVKSNIKSEIYSFYDALNDTEKSLTEKAEELQALEELKKQEEIQKEIANKTEQNPLNSVE